MPSVQDKGVQTFTGLGLTVLQAKAYLALAKEGKSTIKGIAKTSKVARQDLYRVTPQLLNLGLIERHVDTPTKFKAIPIKAAIDMLIEHRKKETARLELEATQFLPSFIVANKEDRSKDEESQFIIISDLQARLAKAKKQIDNVKKSIKIVTKWAFFVTYTLETIEEHTRALNMGVNVKIVTQRPEQMEPPPKNLQKLMKHPLFQIRYVSSLPSSIIAVFDKEEVNIVLSNKTPSESGILMSNNPSLIELAENYFEIMWVTGLEDVNNSNTSIQRAKSFT